MFELILDVKYNTITKNHYSRDKRDIRSTIQHAFDEKWLKNTSPDFEAVLDYYPEFETILEDPENYNLLNIYLTYQLNEAFLISKLNIEIEIDCDAANYQIEAYIRDIMHCLTENDVYFTSFLITKS